MKRILALIFFSFLLLSCGKAFDIKTPDMILDGHAQTVEMKATAFFGLREIYRWHYNENGDLIEDKYPIEDPTSTHNYVGDWFEIHVDDPDSRIARLTVSANETGLARKISIRAACWGKEDCIHVTQNPL